MFFKSQPIILSLAVTVVAMYLMLQTTYAESQEALSSYKIEPTPAFQVEPSERRVFPDNKPKIPQFTFPQDLTAQQKALGANPLLKQFRESREARSSDLHVPAYHYISPSGKMGDANGLCYWKGNWHLFYQAFFPEDEKRPYWGHAISKDLFHWQDLTPALYPDPERSCFSGSTFVEDDRVIAHYHGASIGNMVAISDDPLLLNWEKLTGYAVIPTPPLNPDGSKRYGVYDPCLWKQGDYYYSLSSATKVDEYTGRRKRGHDLFRAKDLVNWEYLHEFKVGDQWNLPGDDGACPYFWPIGENGEKHILLHFSHMSGGKWLLGDYDTKIQKFIIRNGGDFNFGPHGPCGIHAPTAAPDGKGGVIAIFNMNGQIPSNDWTSIMSLPRRLILLPHNELGVEPAPGLESLRTNHKNKANLKLPANKEIILKGIEGRALEIDAEIDIHKLETLVMNVLQSPDKEEYTRIVFQKNAGYYNLPRHTRRRKTKDESISFKDSVITIDTTMSSSLPIAQTRTRPPEVAPVNFDQRDKLRLRVFIDHSSVEVFVNGRQCVAVRVFPGRQDSTRVSFQARGGDAQLLNLDAWQMRSIGMNPETDE